jgi:hypothetical protein
LRAGVAADDTTRAELLRTNAKAKERRVDADRLQRHRVPGVVRDLDTNLQLMADFHGALPSRHGHRRQRLDDSGRADKRSRQCHGRAVMVADHIAHDSSDHDQDDGGENTPRQWAPAIDRLLPHVNDMCGRASVIGRTRVHAIGAHAAKCRRRATPVVDGDAEQAMARAPRVGVAGPAAAADAGRRSPAGRREPARCAASAAPFLPAPVLRRFSAGAESGRTSAARPRPRSALPRVLRASRPAPPGRERDNFAVPRLPMYLRSCRKPTAAHRQRPVGGRSERLAEPR